MSDNTLPGKFRGFSSPNYTPFPDEFADELLADLTGSETKVLVYIIRRTFGFKKQTDDISLQQLTNGIRTKDGRVLDRGTGLSKDAVARSLKSLEEKGIIIRERRRSTDKGDEPTTYSLNFAPVYENRTPPPLNFGQGGVLKSDTQETVVQETVKQEIYPSKTRKAENEKNDYVNPNAPAVNPRVAPQPTVGEDEEHPITERATRSHEDTDGKFVEIEKPSNLRNESKSQQTRKTTPDREEMHKLPQWEAAQDTGSARLDNTVAQRSLPRTTSDDEALDAIRDFIRDLAGKHHDEASLQSSTTRAFNLYQRSGVSLSYLFSVLYDAEKEASRRSTTITKRSADGFPNRMPYIFAYVEDKLGLKDPASPS